LFKKIRERSLRWGSTNVPSPARGALPAGTSDLKPIAAAAAGALRDTWVFRVQECPTSRSKICFLIVYQATRPRTFSNAKLESTRQVAGLSAGAPGRKRLYLKPQTGCHSLSFRLTSDYSSAPTCRSWNHLYPNARCARKVLSTVELRYSQRAMEAVWTGASCAEAVEQSHGLYNVHLSERWYPLFRSCVVTASFWCH